jgi:hypothetical protein
VCDATTRYAGFTFNDRLNDDDAARAPLGETETSDRVGCNFYR